MRLANLCTWGQKQLKMSIMIKSSSYFFLLKMLRQA